MKARGHRKLTQERTEIRQNQGADEKHRTAKRTKTDVLTKRTIKYGGKKKYKHRKWKVKHGTLRYIYQNKRGNN